MTHGSCMEVADIPYDGRRGNGMVLSEMIVLPPVLDICKVI